jgi:hypothetical protein
VGNSAGNHTFSREIGQARVLMFPSATPLKHGFVGNHQKSSKSHPKWLL